MEPGTGTIAGHDILPHQIGVMHPALAQASHRMACVARILLITMTLIYFTVHWADAAADDSAAAPHLTPPAPDASATPASDSGASRARDNRPANHLTVARSIDESVRRLTRGLNLEPGQQEKLRQILLDQYRQIMQLRSGSSAAPADVTGTTFAIYAQTKARIRSMLNDEQQGKYSADVPRDTLAPAQANLQHWMQIQESRRKQGDGSSQ